MQQSTSIQSYQNKNELVSTTIITTRWIQLLQQQQRVEHSSFMSMEVNAIEKLPTFFGLVAYGVAPDYP